MLRRWDDGCCENAEWKSRIDCASLEYGERQPFYHVLVDMRDWPVSEQDPPVAYVPQERLIAPQVC